MAMTDIERAVETLKAKQPRYDTRWRYYDGDQPIRWAADRLKDIFENRSTRFVANWCSVVVDSVLDKMELAGFSVAENDALTERLNDLYTVTTRLSTDEDAIERAALVTGESFVIAWRDNEEGITAYYNDPRVCHVWYQADNPRKKRYAAKWWQDDDGMWFINLYYTDRIEKYQGKRTDRNSTNDVQAKAFELVEDMPNPYGIIPVFHLTRDRYLLMGELENIIPLQDMINKLLGDMMVAAEFGAFQQRWAITNADLSALKNNPKEIWEVPAAGPGDQPTSLGQFDATSLDNYLGAINNLMTQLAIISRTPKHYLYAQGGDPSGEALIAMESPLNRKVAQYQEGLGLGWREVASFLLLLDGAQVPETDISIQWAPSATVQPKTQAEIRQLDIAAGIPLETALRREGWSQPEIDQLAEDRANEQATTGNVGAELLRAFEQGI